MSNLDENGKFLPIKGMRISHEECFDRAATILAEKRCPPGLEADIVRMFKESCSYGHFDEALPMFCAEDSIAYEVAFKSGRADIVIFHIDGSASVIEVKDGSRGYNHVVSGIGQAALYACQLVIRKDVVMRVRKCLLWTSTGDLVVDATIAQACEEANTIPLPWGHIKTHMATEHAIRELIAEKKEREHDIEN